MLTPSAIPPAELTPVFSILLLLWLLWFFARWWCIWYRRTGCWGGCYESVLVAARPSIRVLFTFILEEDAFTLRSRSGGNEFYLTNRLWFPMMMSPLSPTLFCRESREKPRVIGAFGSIWHLTRRMRRGFPFEASPGEAGYHFLPFVCPYIELLFLILFWYELLVYWLMYCGTALKRFSYCN